MLQNRLNVLIAQKGLTIQKIHDDTGLSRTTISNLVNVAGTGIQTSTLNRLCLYLGITPADFFDYVPFDLEYYTEPDTGNLIKTVSEFGTTSSNEGVVQYFRLIIVSDDGQLTGTRVSFDVQISFEEPLYVDNTGYKHNYTAYVYADTVTGSYSDEQKAFKSNYFDKLSLTFREDFYSAIKSELMDFIKKNYFKDFEVIADDTHEISIVLNLPFGRTVESKIDLHHKK